MQKKTLVKEKMELGCNRSLSLNILRVNIYFPIKSVMENIDIMLQSLSKNSEIIFESLFVIGNLLSEKRVEEKKK